MRKIRKLLLIFLLLYILTASLFCKDSTGHNADILEIIYGFSDYNKFIEEYGSESDIVLSYWIVSDSAAFAIDEQGMGKNEDKYASLQKNVATSKTGASLILPSYSKFPSIGGGSHRAYNHQGFYWNYDERTDLEGVNKYLERWLLGRDKILIPCVATAFGLSIGDAKAEVIAVIVYYSHMIGDLLEGTERSVQQMTNITSYYYLMMNLESDLQIALEKCEGDALQFFNDLKMNNQFYQCRLSIRSCRSRSTAFFIAKRFLMEKISPIILKLLSINSIENIDVK